MNDEAVNRTVILVEQTSDHAYTYVHIGGDVDPLAPAACTTALNQLAGCRPTTLCVDLAEVEFADTALLTFLVRVINCAPAGTSVLLCRPTRTVRRLLQLSFLDAIATARDDLPFGSPVAPLAGEGGRRRHAWIRPRVRRLADIRSRDDSWDQRAPARPVDAGVGNADRRR